MSPCLMPGVTNTSLKSGIITSGLKMGAVTPITNMQGLAPAAAGLYYYYKVLVVSIYWGESGFDRQGKAMCGLRLSCLNAFDLKHQKSH